MDNKEMIDRLAFLRDAKKDLEDEIGIIEMNLTRELESLGASRLPHPDYKVTYPVVKTICDTSGLLPLLETDIADELVDAGAIIPKHEETVTVEAKVQWAKLKPFKSLGGDIEKRIDEHTTQVRKIKIEDK